MKLLYLTFFTLFLFSCNPFSASKSPNELEYDSLVVIIKPRINEMLILAQDIEDQNERDSTLLIINDIQNLDFKEISKKYDFKSETDERWFLDGLRISAEICSAMNKLDEAMKGNR